MDWFRMYGEFATDPKVQMLSEADQRRYIMILCMRCSNGDVTLQDEEVAFQLRISNEEWALTKAVLQGKELIDDTNRPTAWNRRQFVSDNSAERVARHRERRKSKGLKAQAAISKETRRKVFENSGFACVYCGSEDDLTIDHKTPEARGGSNEIDNLHVACRVCNASKRDLTHEEFIARNGSVTLQKRPQKTDTDTELTNANALVVASGSAADPCPHQEIIAAYHEALPTCTPVKSWSETRQSFLRQRWREDAKRQRLEWWRRFFAYVAQSRFLTGQGDSSPGRDPFVADLEWLVRPQNFAKVIEGKYHREEVTA